MDDVRWTVWVFLSLIIHVLGLPSYTYLFDDTNGLGRRFDGIGGISGGGATSKLLVNYPEPQRSEILDYLFKPNYGASLQMLKVEIGGDTQTSDGSEASHMHHSWDENYSRGYEWWLMVEAKKRNPDILIYGLPWAFPGWLGAGTESPYTDVKLTASYIVKWVNGCRLHYNITVDYIGIWNEESYNIDYILTLRESLDANGFKNTKIVASDNKWEIVSDIVKNSTLASVVDSIGVHYPGTISPAAALKSGKTLWSSEDYSTYNDNIGGGCWARILNQNYVNGYMTSTISWNLIAAYYLSLPFSGSGLMTAVEPWSGHYEVNSPIWITAHTTQFTKPGWTYLNHSKGVGKLKGGGSYVSLTDGKGSLTIIIETMSRDHSKCIRPFLPKYSVEPQSVIFKLNGSFSKLSTLNVFYSNLSFSNAPSVLFQQQKPIPVKNGEITLDLAVDEVYTLTTITSGQKGDSPVPPTSKPFPLPYSDNFDDYPLFGEPYNFAQQVGSFEIITADDPSRGKILRQVVLQNPLGWCPYINLEFPMNLIGNNSWSDITVQVDVRVGDVNGSQSAFVASRIDQGGCETFAARGVYFFLFPLEQRFEVTNDLSRTIFLTSGAASANFGWNTLTLSILKGTSLGYLNSKLLFNITAPNYPSHGFAGLGSSSFGLTDFDNFKVSKSTDNIFNENVKDLDTLYFKSKILDANL